MNAPKPKANRTATLTRHAPSPAVPGGLTADRRTPRKYVVLNLTDGIAAHPVAMTLSSAQRLIRQFPKRFLAQGSYVTAERKRIRLEDVSLVILDAESDEALFYAATEPGDFAEDSTKTGLDKGVTPDAPLGCKLWAALKR